MAECEMICQGEGNNGLTSTEDKPETFAAFLYLTAFHLTSSALVLIKTVWLQDLRKEGLTDCSLQASLLLICTQSAFLSEKLRKGGCR